MTSVKAGTLLKVIMEREAQDAKWGPQDHQDLSGGVGNRELWQDLWARELVEARGNEAVMRDSKKLGWDLILLEEVFEALSADTEDERIEELIQVVAVGVAWIEAIQRRQARRAEAQAWIEGK